MAASIVKTARFYAESFAPWCEKARWALDHRRVPHRFIEHVPLIGEAALRVAARKPFGVVTVPLLVDEHSVIMGSLAIAQHAERKGEGASLFVDTDAVLNWDKHSEALMSAGRALLLGRMLRNPDALREQVPRFVPKLARATLGAAGVRFIVRKHEVALDDEARHEAQMRRVLDELTRALDGGRLHLIGDGFSYADITMAAALQFILPVDDRYIHLGRATREAWTHRVLAREYAELFTWRDRLYERLR